MTSANEDSLEVFAELAAISYAAGEPVYEDMDRCPEFLAGLRDEEAPVERRTLWEAGQLARHLLET